MRMYIMLLMALCLQVAARGQTEWHYEYWFDNDRNNVQRGSSDVDSWHMDVDLSGLSETLHAFHFQVVNDTMPSIPVTRFFVKTPNQSSSEGRYWFDSETSQIHTANELTGTLNIDVSQLSDGIHTLFIQAMSHDGTVSSTVSRMFYKNYLSGAATGRYWFDDEIDKMHQSENVGGLMDIDVSELDEGLHTIHYQVVGTGGSISSTASRSFYKVYISTGVSWRCWFDNDFSTVQSGDGVDDTLLLDVTNLADGFHVIHIQADGGSGAASVPISKPFLKVPQTIGVDDYTCLCMVDDQLYKEEKIPAGNGFVEWNFDVSQLSQGFHRLFIQIVTPSGAASNAYEAFFLRETTNAEFAEMKCVYAIDGAEFNNEAGTLANGTYHFDLDVSSLEDGLHRISYMLTNGKGTSTKTQTQFFMKTPLGGNGITEYWYWLNDEADSNAQKVTLPERPNPFSLISLLPVESQPLRSSLFQFRVEQNKPVVYAKNDIHIRFYDAAGRFTDVSKQFVDENVKQEVTDVEWLEPGVRATTEKPDENTIKWYKVEAEKGDSLQFKLDRAATIQLFSPSGKELYSASGAESTKWGGCHAEEDGIFYVALHDVTATQGTTVSIDYEHIDKYAVLRQDVTAVGNKGRTPITFYGNGFDELTDVYLVHQSEIIHAAEIESEGKAMTCVTFNFDGVSLGQYKAVFQFTEGNLEIENCITVEEATDIDIDVTATFGKNNLLSFHKTKYIFSVHNNSNVTAYDVPLMIRVYTHDVNSLERVDIEGYDLKKDFVKTLGDLYTDSLDNIINQNRRISGDRSFFLETDSTDIVAGWAAHMHQVFVNPTIPPHSTKDIVVSLQLGQSVYCYMWHPEIWDDKAEARSNGRLKVGNFIGCSKAVFKQIKKCFENGQKEKFKPQAGGSGYLGLRRRAKDNDCAGFNGSIGCPGDGGNSAGHGSDDPNDITGYTSESGSKYINGDVLTLDYAIEFENDKEFATASAHNIVVKDTLDSRYFDLDSYKPTSIRIGEKEADLDGSPNFMKTIDMRPEINAVAQVKGTYDRQKGIATWDFTSLDPMTMEPTDDYMSGILPVNYNGTSGIGKVFFDVNLKQQLTQGTEIPNRAGIVFDKNETIVTPTWTNIIDRIAPESHVADVQMATDTTAAVRISATDELSGPWRYNVYVQYGSGTWFLGAENVPIDSVARVKVYEGIDHGFYTVVTDSAGNVEQKEAAREFSFEVFAPQVETNTKLQLAEGWNWISQNQNVALSAEAVKPKAKRIMSQTEELYKDARFGWTGDLEELLPTEMYKVQATESGEVQLSGLLFNAAFRCIPLREGWNWIGYPLGKTMTPAEAFAKFEAEEDDAVIGRDGLATYSGGLWQGTLTEMQPGCGYMFHSVSDKSLFLNASAQVSSRLVGGAQSIVPPHYPDNWTVDKQKYPNVMGVVAELYQNDQSVSESNEWLLGAFNGDECRGLAQLVSGKLMMNVYGQGGEKISFLVMHRDTGEILSTSESEPFSSGMLGTMRQPYLLNIGVPTGITTNGDWKRTGVDAAYDLQGRKVDADNSQKGIYIMTDVKNGETQKVVRK